MGSYARSAPPPPLPAALSPRTHPPPIHAGSISRSTAAAEGERDAEEEVCGKESAQIACGVAGRGPRCLRLMDLAVHRWSADCGGRGRGWPVGRPRCAQRRIACGVGCGCGRVATIVLFLLVSRCGRASFMASIDSSAARPHPARLSPLPGRKLEGVPRRLVPELHPSRAWWARLPARRRKDFLETPSTTTVTQS